MAEPIEYSDENDRREDVGSSSGRAIVGVRVLSESSMALSRLRERRREEDCRRA